MKIIKFFYEKYRNLIENSLFVIILAFYPLIRINQGLDVSDTAYSLVNFQYFPSADGTWQTATYLANAAGYLFMQLPKGDTLLGMNFYTGLIVSFIALLFYYTMRKKCRHGLFLWEKCWLWVCAGVLRSSYIII